MEEKNLNEIGYSDLPLPSKNGLSPQQIAAIIREREGHFGTPLYAKRMRVNLGERKYKYYGPGQEDPFYDE